MKENAISSLTSRKILARNTLLSFAGQMAPLLVALFSIPYLIRHFGIDRFGVLTLVWVIIGYFSLFDLGLGRALTQMVAQRIGTPQQNSIPSLVWLCLALMLALGIAGALILGYISHWLIYEILKVPPELREETRSSFILLSLSLPFVISTAALRGLLEAKQCFGLLNAVRIPLGIFMYLGPFLVLPFSPSLFYVVFVLVVGRIAAWAIHLIFCLQEFPSLRSKPNIDLSQLRPLVQFGGFITISNIISPLLANIDRFIIGALVSVTAVAYYTTPYEVVTKIWIIPGALTSVLFPAFSTSYIQDKERTLRLFHLSVKYIFIALFPIVVGIVAFSADGIEFWLGAEFARHSARLLQFMAIGVFFNSFALIPFALIQAAGRPSWAALLHFIELPFYVATIWFMVIWFGLEGAAIAWLARIVIDTAALFWISGRILPAGVSGATRRLRSLASISIPVIGLFFMPFELIVKIPLFIMILISFSAVSWSVLLDKGERNLLTTYFRKIQHLAKRCLYVFGN
jgi:O-antigen/teichoic acid export membrane protein